MYDLSDELIAEMDMILLDMKEFDNICNKVPAIREGDEALNAIVEFTKYHRIGKEMNNGDCLGYDEYTKSFIRNGGFRGHYYRINEESIKEDARQITKDELNRVSLLKLKLWFWLFLGAMLWHVLRYL